MILINVRYRPKPEFVESFREKMDEFTQACRQEPGCLFFEWYRNTDDPNEYILIEAYKDAEAGKVHAESDHFAKGIEEMNKVLQSRPKIINTTMEDRSGWDDMSEVTIDGDE
ncbi:antibiotic biosynthesis monooxygenase [Corynebacterium sp. MC-04]|uniref:Antibiotic biosynthesis monooxygenase n=1 Tax=Corynebacterium parakroppenstedtii TaxID=2828363 RepID=A0ABS9HM35_9CORY|nr:MULTISPECIES: putative quinol monooxygenase [Corynebacterium]KXB50303.1 antibiotic biosynthesis monooxygenase [Corynebacterium kroppenstedtii]MBY0788961.1 antibiotic biosynthesis monooxygenase [Corynebacterium parakroppenstedtii]MBY0793024.1 antibiotic biosynthesis monooxygenase [Corynebacterium parakroppenstedtii]MBY0797812.1 antibiotic biosynthesis monooxygenase [Corynebacterium parakroppenstedtii]MCF6769528.1 antibiotic biosynthesis monooxygenase [Corynebacterium parakroppenstedtii]